MLVDTKSIFLNNFKLQLSNLTLKFNLKVKLQTWTFNPDMKLKLQNSTSTKGKVEKNKKSCNIPIGGRGPKIKKDSNFSKNSAILLIMP